MMKEATLKQINKAISKFIWSNGKPKIAMKILQNIKPKGGLKLVSLKHREFALKIGWVKTLSINKRMTVFAYEALSSTLQEEIWLLNIKRKHVQQLFNPGFWRDVLIAWSELTYNSKQLPTSTFIWYNSDVCIKGKPFLWTKIYKNGLKFFEQLRNGSTWRSFNEVHIKYGLTILQYKALVELCPKYIMEKHGENQQGPAELNPYKQLLQKSNLTQYVYNILVTQEKCLSNRIKRWEHELNMEIEEDTFYKCFSAIHSVTNVQITDANFADKCTFVQMEDERLQAVYNV